jgi:hypothetical protein
MPNLGFQSDGYFVLRRAASCDPRLLARLRRRANRAGSIFNHGIAPKSRNDHKRRQTQISLKECEAPGLCHLVSKHGNGSLPAKWSALFSYAGCQAQAPHADWTPCLNVLQGADAMGCIVALENGTRFDVWPGSHRYVRMDGQVAHKPIRRKRLRLSAGDVLFFRSDLVHAGASYSVPNIRLHCYLDAPHIFRAPNRTWLVHRHAHEALRALIMA